MSLILTSIISIPQTSVSFSTMALMFFPFPLLESIVSNSTFPHTSLKAACASCVIAKLNFSTFSIAFSGSFT
jgi:hypothetical protein